MSTRMLGWVLGAMAMVACSASPSDETNASTDPLKREGESIDTSDVFDESQCESILKAATASVREEALSGAPKRMLLHVKDIQCLAYETQMRERTNAQGERIPNPYDVLLPQLFAAARMGSKAGFGGAVTPPTPPPGTPGRPRCLDAFEALRNIDVSVSPTVQERQVCYTFGRAIQAYLGSHDKVKTFLQQQIRINVVAEGAAVFDEVLGVMQLPWNYDENALGRALVSKPSFLREMYDVRIGQGGIYTSGVYGDNQNGVPVGGISLAGRIAELKADFGEVVKLRVQVEMADFETCLDYITIKDASDRVLKKICKSPPPGEEHAGPGATFDLPLSPSYKMFLFSDTSQTGTGARLQWSVVIP